LSFWTPWVGLPWELGADPRLGRAACCFKTAQAVREALGLPWPASQTELWYAEAQLGAWDGLRRDWDELAAPTDCPQPGTLIRFDNLDGSFGVGVLPDERTLVTVRHRGRLIAGPLSVCSSLKLYLLR